MNDINICGVLVHARPGLEESVEKQLTAFPGVEVHEVTENSRMIITIEAEGNQRMLADTMAQFHDVEGVLSASLIYQHSE